jgi:copper chaperone CopZ
MKHTYHIHGMTCNGCRSHVEEILSKVDGVSTVTVDLEKAEATIEMGKHIPIEKFQETLKKDGGRYNIHKQGEKPHPASPKGRSQDTENRSSKKSPLRGLGAFYCPMHCEGDKTYNKPGDCPVCGMDLVEEQNLSATTSEQWTCPMHPG